MPSAELIGLEAPKKAHRSLVFALAAPCRQIESAAGIGQVPLGAARCGVGAPDQFHFSCKTLNTSQSPSYICMVHVDTRMVTRLFLNCAHRFQARNGSHLDWGEKFGNRGARRLDCAGYERLA